jgi:hypothetical protein
MHWSGYRSDIGGGEMSREGVNVHVTNCYKCGRPALGGVCDKHRSKLIEPATQRKGFCGPKKKNTSEMMAEAVGYKLPPDAIKLPKTDSNFIKLASVAGMALKVAREARSMDRFFVSVSRNDFEILKRMLRELASGCLGKE